MAITQALCTQFLKDILDGVHEPGDTYKIALFTSAAALDAATTGYSGQAGEVANGNGYVTGGQALAGRASAIQGGKGTLDFTDPVWPASSITARGALIYNDTQAGKPAICVLDFGADITSTNDNFTVDLPASGAGTSLVRLG